MYCVYLTEYLGDKMPKYYLGSTSMKKINEGYRGSVSSKKYKSIWDGESDSMFRVKVLETFSTRKEALDRELELHLELDVVNNSDYINLSMAQPNGFFGIDVSGKNNPMYGKLRKGEKHKGGENISSGLKTMYATDHGKTIKEKSRIRLTENNPAKQPLIVEKNKETWKNNNRNAGEKNGMYGKPHPMKSKRLYNNGKITKAFVEGQQPFGWVIGRVMAAER